MKGRGIFFGLTVFLSMSTGNAFPQTTVKDYWEHKTRELMLIKKEGTFYVAVTPVPIELSIAQEYPKWEEKRYSVEEMIAQAMIMRDAGKDRLLAAINIGLDKEGAGLATSMTVPDDISEYIFLENDAGKFVRCESAQLPIVKAVNIFNQTVGISVGFSDPLHVVLGNTKSIKIVAGGLGLKDTAFIFRVPFSSMFGDAPPELRAIYNAIGVGGKQVERHSAGPQVVESSAGRVPETPQPVQENVATEPNEPDEEVATTEDTPEEGPQGVSEVVIDTPDKKFEALDPTKGYIAVLSMDENGKKRKTDSMNYWSFYFDAKFRMKRPGKNIKGHPKGGYMGIFLGGIPTGKHVIRLVAKPSNNFLDTDIEIVPSKVLVLRVDIRGFPVKPNIDEVKYLDLDVWNSRFQRSMDYFGQILYIDVANKY